MKILILSANSSDSGCWLKTQYLAKGLQNAGNEVVLVKPLKSKPFMLEYLLSMPIYFFKTMFTKCDVAICIKSYPNVTFPLLIKRLFGTKIVLDIDDLDYGYRSGIISEVSKIVQRPFPRFFDLVTYHNDKLKEHAIKDMDVKDEKLFKVDQGVDMEVFDPEVDVDALGLRKKYGINGEKLIVYTAHLNIASDLDAIFKAFKLVLEKFSCVRLMVVGGGQMLDDFKALCGREGISDKVIFTGYVNNKKVKEYVKAGDMCVVYYKDKLVNHYRASMKIREYLAMGKKVVSNDLGELKNFKDYAYQSKTDVNDFAEKIVSVLSGKVDDRYKKSREFINEHYSWDVIGKKFDQKLRKLLSS